MKKIRNEKTGVEINYYEQGGGGRPIILLHGLAGNHTRWTPAADLLGQSMRVIGYDLRGHGLSQKSDDLAYDFDTHADDLAGMMDKFGLDSAIIAGHSMGGMIAQRFAAKYPQRVDGLVLVATTACMMPNFIINFLFRFVAWLVCFMPALIGSIIRNKTKKKPRDLFPEWDRPELDFNNTAVAQCFKSIAFMDYRRENAALNTPTLVLCSSEDELINPARVRELAEGINGADFRTIENHSHYLPLEQPEKVALSISEFSAALDSGPESAAQEPVRSQARDSS